MQFSDALLQSFDKARVFKVRRDFMRASLLVDGCVPLA
jgi:hypothetical protein